MHFCWTPAVPQDVGAGFSWPTLTDINFVSVEEYWVIGYYSGTWVRYLARSTEQDCILGGLRGRRRRCMQIPCLRPPPLG